VAFADTVRGVWHFLTDRKPGDLETRPPKPFRRAAWLREGIPLVSKVKAQDDIKSSVEKCLELLGGLEKAVQARDRVLVKPNFSGPDRYPASTDLDFLRAVLELLTEAGAQVVVGECSGGIRRPTKVTVQKLGVPGMLQRMGIDFVAFDADETEWVEIPVEGEFLRRVTVPKVAYEADKLVYLPCMKTHYLARFSLSLKLSMGFVHPGERRRFHMGNLERKLAEINLVWQPDLIIMDGRKAFITGGPAKGKLAEPGVILGSGDMVAIDLEGLKVLQSYRADNRLGGDAIDLPQIGTAINRGLTPAGGAYEMVE
jgi:uncharacterized protein (DUF362 family)